jgi:hypothetical protein
MRLTILFASCCFALGLATPASAELALYKYPAVSHCQATRTRVLAAESTIPATFDPKGCHVIAGRWLDPYSGRTFTDPHDLEIDHLVPLDNVQLSGGAKWSPEQRHAYANDLTDPNTMVAVWGHLNRQKGDKGPDRWLPPNDSFRCEYVRRWAEVKTRWHLAMAPVEAKAVSDRLQSSGQKNSPSCKSQQNFS